MVVFLLGCPGGSEEGPLEKRGRRVDEKGGPAHDVTRDCGCSVVGPSPDLDRGTPHV